MRHLIETLLLPPAGSILLFLSGAAAVLGQRRGLGYGLAAAGFLYLYLASNPVLSQRLLDTLQTQYPVLEQIPASVQAIVVLAAGQHYRAEEYGGDTVNALSLERLRYAAYLQRKSGLPLLASGGRGPDDRASEAALMKPILENELGASVRWIETTSQTTYENAINSARILKPAGIEHIVLVTHAFHMPRAVWSFEQTGLKVTPAPTAFYGGEAGAPLQPGEFIVPKWEALTRFRLAMHEWLGLAWYKLRYGQQ